MLVVGPGSGMLPVAVSVLALMTATLLLTESKTSKVFLSGDISIRPGELPALIPPLPIVSFAPSMIKRPGNAVGVDTLCEAATRVVNPLGGL
jgi:hypothetical protein